MEEGYARNIDRLFMQKALELAVGAYKDNEVPIGAVVVSAEGILLGTGSNKTEQLNCQSRHAEVLALEEAGKSLGDWRLEGCVLYVTIEPCLMCMSSICLSRVSRVVYGAESPLFGHHLDTELLPRLYKKHIRGITSGVCREEAQQLIEKFFKEKRGKSEEFRKD